MTALSRAIRKLAEKVAGSFKEGPEPPGRLRRVAEEFAAAHPKATRKQWLDFAAAHAAAAYQSGYLRGYEWAEREPGPTSDDVERAAALLADESHDQEWVATQAPTEAALLLDAPVEEGALYHRPPEADYSDLERRMRDEYFERYRKGVGPRRI